MSFVDLLFSFQGRIGRGTYWFAVLLQTVLVLVVAVLVAAISVRLEAGANNLLPIVGVAGLSFVLMIWSGWAVQAKRLHDRDKSAWWALLVLVPVIGPIWHFVELGCLAGTPGDNRFGPPQSFGSRAGSEPLSDFDADNTIEKWRSAAAPASAARPVVAARAATQAPVVIRTNPTGGFGRRGLK